MATLNAAPTGVVASDGTSVAGVALSWGALANVQAMASVEAAMQAGHLKDGGDFVSTLAQAISTALDPEVAELGDQLDDCEAAFEDGDIYALRRRIAVLRSQAIALRRFVDWVSAYTLAPPGPVLRMAMSVPSALEAPKTELVYRPAAPTGDTALKLTAARRRVLEQLKDDPALYVRRSVANNLNDIGKDHPGLLADTARAWLQGATPERSWTVQHALRSAVKRGEAGALAALGFGETANVVVSQPAITPAQAVMGGSLTVAFDVTNTTAQPQQVLVDFAVHYVKANGQARAKVFKLKTLDLAPHETQKVGKKISLADMTTRKHYPGHHRVDAILNGRFQPLGAFDLTRG
mgnify:CR=1 FL=1